MEILKRLTIIVCLVIGWSANAAEPKPAFCYLPTESGVSYSQVTELPTGSPDAIIHYGPDPLQFGELWLPPRANTDTAISHPLLILVHGGCWLNAYDIKHTHALSTALSNAGYAVWAIEYRRSGDPGGGWPGSLEDVKRGIEYVSSLEDYSVNNDRPALAGHSAGGHLALLAAAQLEMDFAAVIGLAPIVDITEYAGGENSCQTATAQFMGGMPEQKAEQYAAANPAGRTLPPNTVLIHGSNDVIVPLAQSTAVDESTRVLEGAGHFDLIHPGTPAHRQLLKELAQAFR